ncbi:hypothetical protein MB27_00705 [Actinoplanes utahensis]|uniref:Lipoprotein n=2 Tax=Actinoplanes utahensis TaxID=1869 RepID=A0A0A6UUR3_ACTUT|nr:hypothetical protein MB27_00705 [Actinoplanes utahensis]
MLRGGASLMLAATLALAGCGSSDNGGGGGGLLGGDKKDASVALTEATTKMQETSYKTKMDLGGLGTMTGVSDGKKKVHEFVMDVTTQGQTVNTTMRIIDGVTYMKMKMDGASTLPGFDGKTWRKIEGGGPGSLGGFDASQMTKSLQSAVDAKWEGDVIKGTIDMSKSAESLGLGGQAAAQVAGKSVPFEAKLDGEGRLTNYKLDMSSLGAAGGASKYDITYSDYGTPVDVQVPPASEIAKS